MHFTKNNDQKYVDLNELSNNCAYEINFLSNISDVPSIAHDQLTFLFL